MGFGFRPEFRFTSTGHRLTNGFPFRFSLTCLLAAASHSPVGGVGGRAGGRIFVLIVVGAAVVVAIANLLFRSLVVRARGLVAIVVVCVVLYLFYISGIVLTIWCFLL